MFHLIWDFVRLKWYSANRAWCLDFQGRKCQKNLIWNVRKSPSKGNFDDRLLRCNVLHFDDFVFCSLEMRFWKNFYHFFQKSSTHFVKKFHLFWYFLKKVGSSSATVGSNLFPFCPKQDKFFRSYFLTSISILILVLTISTNYLYKFFYFVTHILIFFVSLKHENSK